jgi:hypothetical protein
MIKQFREAQKLMKKLQETGGKRLGRLFGQVQKCDVELH